MCMITPGMKRAKAQHTYDQLCREPSYALKSALTKRICNIVKASEKAQETIGDVVMSEQSIPKDNDESKSNELDLTTTTVLSIPPVTDYSFSRVCFCTSL